MKTSVAGSLALFLTISVAFVFASDEKMPGAIDVGQTGFANKRPVFAAVYPHACPLGELGDFVKEAMEPFGYDVMSQSRSRVTYYFQKCPTARLNALDAYTGTTTRVNANVDFGATVSDFESRIEETEKVLGILLRSMRKN